MTSTGSDRLFTLLGDLSPDLLAVAFPESGEVHNASAFRARHAKRIGRMILLYAACAVLLIGAVIYLPRLFHQINTPPVTTAPPEEEMPLGYPDDYFRPDLVWANENVELRRENAVEGEYHAIDFEFLEDEDAVYAIYMKYMNGEYMTSYSQDLGSKSGADFEPLRVSSAEKYRIVEDTKARYYAGTRAQIQAYFDYIEKTYQTEDESQRIRICLAYQTLRPSVIDGKWNPDLLKPSKLTGYETTIPSPAYVNCIQGSTPTPVIRPNAKEITFSFTVQEQEHSNGIIETTHTVSYQPKGPDISVLIGGTWYDIPWVAPADAKDTKLDVPEDGEASFTLSFADFPHGDLPAGQYRFVFPFKGEHILSDRTVLHGEQTHVVLFMVTSGDDCISPGATQGLAYTLMENGTYSVRASAYMDMNATQIVIPSVYCGIPVTAVSDFGFNSYFGHDTPYALLSVTLPNTITTIGEEAFVGCPNLESINFPASLTSIGRRAFSGCELKEVVLPNGITEIAESAFEMNTLTKLVLPDTLVSIGYRAFQSCGMTEVVMPKSVQFIAEDAFGSCNWLESVIFEDTKGWIALNRVMDLTSPAQNAYWLTHTAAELKRGTSADIDTSKEAARWAIEDANIDFAFASYEEAERFALSYAEQKKGCFPLPRIDDPDTKVSYHFYGIVDSYDQAAGWNQSYRAGMMVIAYEDQNVSMEGKFYALSFTPDANASKLTRELSHEDTLRTYVYMLDETVFADLSITAKDPTLSGTDMHHILTIMMLSNQLKLLGS